METEAHFKYIDALPKICQNHDFFSDKNDHSIFNRDEDFSSYAGAGMWF